jgi:hypothetical protein
MSTFADSQEAAYTCKIKHTKDVILQYQWLNTPDISGYTQGAHVHQTLKGLKTTHDSLRVHVYIMQECLACEHSRWE